MDNQIRFVFIANAGVLIEFQGTKLLIDGIYADEGHSFSCIPSVYWDEMKRGKGLLADVDYLLFTHEHADHFSPERVMEYLDYQNPKAIFMPKKGSSALEKLQFQAEDRNIPCTLLQESFCKRAVFMPEKEIKIIALATKHLDRRYKNVSHFCYLIQLGSKNILITGDVDFKSEQMTELQDIYLDAVLLNPLTNHSREGKDFLRKHIQARKKIIYHIPFEGEDSTQIRILVEKGLCKKNNDSIYFMETGQACYL